MIDLDFSFTMIAVIMALIKRRKGHKKHSLSDILITWGSYIYKQELIKRYMIQKMRHRDVTQE